MIGVDFAGGAPAPGAAPSHEGDARSSGDSPHEAEMGAQAGTTQDHRQAHSSPSVRRSEEGTPAKSRGRWPARQSMILGDCSGPAAATQGPNRGRALLNARRPNPPAREIGDLTPVSAGLVVPRGELVVLDSGCVRVTIDFNNQSSLLTDEVDDVRPIGCCSSCEATPPKVRMHAIGFGKIGQVGELLTSAHRRLGRGNYARLDQRLSVFCGGRVWR